MLLGVELEMYSKRFWPEPGVANPPDLPEEDVGVDEKDSEVRTGCLPFRFGIAIAFEPDIPPIPLSITDRYQCNARTKPTEVS
jgi:hypothetical protein